MTQLVIGNRGQVGAALQEVLGCNGHDVDNPLEGHFDVLHVTFPYSDKFIEQVKAYQVRYTPAITIVHSTVKIGTCRQLGAIMSPIHGVHPNLAPGIRTFIKYIGAIKREDAEIVLRLFQEKGIKGFIVDNPETAEISKSGCTTRHALMIIEEKLFKQRCDSEGANFEQAYTMWNRFYGIGYEELGMPYIRRAIVKHVDGPIGGHCQIPNARILGGPVAEFILNENGKF